MSFSGCRGLSGSPDRDWLNDFARTDAIELRAGGSYLLLTDTAAINRLNGIYSNADWERYWHTLPATVSDRTIAFQFDDQELRRLSYTGVLWELGGHDDVRTAKLRAEDSEWLESLFASLSRTQAPGESDNARGPSAGGTLQE